MELEYIKANGIYYTPQKAGVKDKSKNFSNYPVCIIKKISFGRFQIDYYDIHNCNKFKTLGCNEEDKPNTRVILYPSGIEQIVYKTK